MKKSKHGRPITGKHAAWPIYMSGLLVLMWILLKIALARFPAPPNTLIVYPLYAVMTSPTWQWVIAGSLFLAVVVLHRVAFLRGLYRWMIAPSLLVQGGAIFFTVFTFANSPFFTMYLQSVSMNQRTYHLVLTQDRGYFETIRRYDVLECDLSGLLCQHYATPYQREGNCFEILASLEIDPTTQHLVLRLDNETYSLDPDNPMKWSPCARPLTR